ncbi:MAG: hypothetical protein H7325_12265 [Pedobacter sp.]|nr:hypothetical protein [Pedobacter sp.]
MSTDNKSIKLIDGVFNADDAAEILFSVLEAKIRFHNLQMMSVAERFNGSTKDHESRLQVLEDSKKIVAKIILQAREGNSLLNINSIIEIDFQ